MDEAARSKIAFYRQGRGVVMVALASLTLISIALVMKKKLKEKNEKDTFSPVS